MIERKTPVEALASLQTYAMSIRRLPLRTLCQAVLQQPEFAKAWGSSSEAAHHHSYPGGLAVHTYEVVQYLVGLQHRTTAELDILITAAIMHDYGKIWDYDENGKKTPTYNLFRHVTTSFAEYVVQTRQGGVADSVDATTLENIGHCILAHHGRKEWGSPVEPQTEEALLLHQADMWSSQYGPGKERV